MKRMVAALVTGVFLLGAADVRTQLAYPPTPVRPVTDTYFGHKVVDPYRWLESGTDPAVKSWAAAQTTLTRSFLESQPSYATFRARVGALSKTSTERFGLVVRGRRLFYERLTPPQAQPQYIVRDGIHGAERVLFDPQKMLEGGLPPAIESVFVSPDGSKVAFTTQPGGTENETLHVVDTATGTLLSDTIAHVGGGTSPTALVWDGDGRGFIHTEFPKNPDGTYATGSILLYHHVLGTAPSSDIYVFGRGGSPRAEYALLASADGTLQAISVAAGDGVHNTVYLRAQGGPFVKVADPADAVGSSADPGAAFVGDRLLLISKKPPASRGEIVAVAPGQTFANGTLVVPAGPLVITALEAVRGGFITDDVDGGDSVARFFDERGTLRHVLPLPAHSAIAALGADPRSPTAIVGYQGYATPTTWLAYDAASNALAPTGIAVRAPGDYSKVIVRRVFVRSLDGRVRIPLEIVALPGTKTDGTAPTIMTAYGAYGIISTPFFIGPLLAWLERGGVFAQAMVRGGGEYGEQWADAARLATKTLSSDDLAACAQWLGRNGYGDAQHLGVFGGSAGGFLMGLALTRNPSDYRAVVSEVGFYDLLRIELTPNGAFNTPEFGTVKDPAQFAWMVKQSPYENVVKGRAYPAALLPTGENDPRVAPYNSRKMVAKLQADSSSPYPELLLQRAGQGHGIGNSFEQDVQDRTDTLTFFESQLH
ncbi:MAG: prolyl oligopeptidase family serine peptidase [Vulcanimicrobiaceae bacterium]